MVLPGKPRGSPTLKAAGCVTAAGRGGASRGGVDDRGALEEDGPVTWEAPVCPRALRGLRRRRTQMEDLRGLRGSTLRRALFTRPGALWQTPEAVIVRLDPFARQEALLPVVDDFNAAGHRLP